MAVSDPRLQHPVIPVIIVSAVAVNIVVNDVGKSSLYSEMILVATIRPP